MSAYYEEKVVDPPVGDPLPFKLNYSPRAYELPGQPISLDKSGTVVARQVGGGVPRKPFRVTVITEAAKPATVTAGALPEKPVSVFVLTSVDAPESVTVVAAPRKPNTVSVQADPIKPASVTADAMPFAPTSVAAFSDPKKPTSIDADYIPYAPASVTADAIPFAPTSVVAESDPKKPISVDVDYIPHAPAIVEVNAMPIAPVGVAAFSDPKKPISVDADYIPYAPSSVDADYIPHAPSVVSVNADPKQPLTVDADYIPYAPASVSAGQVPNTPSLVEAGVIPEVPSTVSVLAAPRQPSLAYAFEPFIVGIMEPEADIVARPASTPEGTVAFGTDTKKLYVFNKTGMDSWGAFAQDASYKYDQYSIKTDFEYPPTTGYFGAVLSKKYATSGAQEFTHSGGIAFSAWFKINEHNNDSHIISLSTGGSYDGGWHQTSWGSNINFITTSVQNKLSFRMGGVSHSIGDIEYGKWHHLAFSWIGDTFVNSTTSSGPCRVYLDGQTIFDDTKSTNLNFQGSTFPFVINTNSYPTEGWVRNFAGNVSELAVWNHPLTPVEVSDMYYNGVPQLLDLNPTAWWRMGDGSEGASGTAIENVVGDGYQGNIIKHGNEPITLTYEEDSPMDFIPFNRYSVNVDGSSSYLTIPSSTSLETTEFTWSAWFYCTEIDRWNVIVDSSQHQWLYHSYFIGINPDNKIKASSYDSNSTIESTTVVSANTWYHVALTTDNGDDKLYVNGSLEASGTASNFSTTDTSKLRIGSSEQYNLYHKGSIDEVSFFNSALPATDISTIYNDGTPTDIEQLNPVGWWRMGERGGIDTIIDQGSGGNDATLVSGVTFSTDVP